MNIKDFQWIYVIVLYILLEKLSELMADLEFVGTLY